jgi:uridine phosphorylase
MRAWRREHGMLPARTIDSAIILYQDQLFRAVPDLEATSPLGGQGVYRRVVTLDRTDGRVAVIGGFGIGAPAAAVVLEELIANGAHRFVSMGTAGGLQPDLAAGDVVVCTSAVRDEGVSHHYAPADVIACPDAALTDELERAIRARGLPARRGAAWTIDTPYRETAAEARHYQAEGVQCVEMEAAALFTVAAYRNVQLASAFCISDSLADADWNPMFDHEDLITNMLGLFAAAVDTLS